MPVTQQSVAAVLAPLAVLAVVVAATSAGIGFAREGDQTDGAADPGGSTGSSETVPDGFVRVADAADGTGASYLVPDDDAWDVRPADEPLGLTPDAEPAVTGAAAYREGACAQGEEDAPVAFVGFVEPRDAAGTTPQEAAADVAATWADAAASGNRGGGDDREDPTLTPVRLDDQTAAWTAAVVVGDPVGPCPGTAAVEIRALSLLTGEQVTTVVLARTTGADGEDQSDSLDAAGADAVLRSVTAD